MQEKGALQEFIRGEIRISFGTQTSHETQKMISRETCKSLSY